MQDFEISEKYKLITDEELVILYRNGVQDAFTAIAVRYVYVIRRLASGFSNMSVEFDDLLQEGNIGLVNAVNTYKNGGTASFRTYAGVCIRNRMISVVRKANSSLNSINNEALPLSEQTEVLSAPDTEPESFVDSVERTKEIFRVIRENLSELERNVLSLYIDGKRYEEIAADLGITVKVCNNAMQRVRKKLRFLR